MPHLEGEDIFGSAAGVREQGNQSGRCQVRAASDSAAAPALVRPGLGVSVEENASKRLNLGGAEGDNRALTRRFRLGDLLDRVQPQAVPRHCLAQHRLQHAQGLAERRRPDTVLLHVALELVDDSGGDLPQLEVTDAGEQMRVPHRGIRRPGRVGQLMLREARPSFAGEVDQ